MKVRITENLDVDTDARRWSCHHCDHDLGAATENYKRECLLAARDPNDVWQAHVQEQVTFSYHRDWCRLVEFYCPGCGWLIEVEVLPPGHPLTHDIQLDLIALNNGAAAREGVQ